MDQNTKETYSAVVVTNALQVSSGGTESVAIQFHCNKLLGKNEDVDRTFVGNLYLSSRAIDNTIKTLKDALGYTKMSFKPLNYPDELKGIECEITVQYEEYNGEMRPKVQWINKSGSYANRSLKPVDDSKADDISSRLDAYFKNYGNQSASSQKAKSSEEDDDDLPF